MSSDDVINPDDDKKNNNNNNKNKKNNNNEDEEKDKNNDNKGRVTYGTITVTRGEACDVSESIGASSSSGYGISSSDSSSSNISVEPISSSGTPSNLGQSEHRLPPTPKKTLKRKKIQAASSRANPVTARRKLNFDSATGQSSTPTLPPPVASASAPTETSTAAGLSSITTSGPSFSSSSTPIGELFESDQKYNSKKYNFDFKEGKPLAGENYKWSSNRGDGDRDDGDDDDDGGTEHEQKKKDDE
ncbi:hypothetical protein HELRODRAFT_179327 [Helobdella robusta]|uniref:Cyclin-dependent kinase inhibitor domain-containing protein n=1 Tax=Helobdella robusta TaxID=6412 RepID=T1FEK0_HELRO|nr:hypothetical protein HELRODRAFT_179327 [Helobdella robusta]ESN95551.1 hypothetical protein HELRODRAFT_179327 [Helobdella robusta]